MTPPMMMPKQKPLKPAPPMAPSWAAVKLNSAPQLSKIPPRMAKPTPAARIAMNPAQRSRAALGAMPSVLADINAGNSWELVEGVRGGERAVCEEFAVNWQGERAG